MCPQTTHTTCSYVPLTTSSSKLLTTKPFRTLRQLSHILKGLFPLASWNRKTRGYLFCLVSTEYAANSSSPCRDADIFFFMFGFYHVWNIAVCYRPFVSTYCQGGSDFRPTSCLRLHGFTTRKRKRTFATLRVWDLAEFSSFISL